MENDFSTGKYITWTIKRPSESGHSTEEFDAFIDEYLNIEQQGSHISGEVIFNNGEYVIIEIKEMTSDLFPFTLFYNEVRNRLDLDKESNDPYQKYFCLDIASMTSLFFYDINDGYLADAVYDDEGAFDYYDLPDLEGLNEDSPETSSMFLEQIFIELDESEINDYEEKEALATTDDQGRITTDKEGNLVGQESCSWHRAVSWFNTRDCAVLTAWRNGKGRKTNDDNNRVLQKQLRDLGYGVTKLTGWYAEEGKDYERENSYLTVNLNDEEDFRDKIFKLSEHYEQESFLYKEAGIDKPALYIYTNEEKGKGRIELLGRLRIGNMDAKAYSQIKTGRITFE